MNIIKQFGVVLGITYLGDLISKLSGLPIPGPVIGMFILFLLLYKKIIKIESINLLAELLLVNLAFFFIPPGVGILASTDILSGNWIKLILVVVLTTIVTILVTGLTVDYIIKKRSNKND